MPFQKKCDLYYAIINPENEKHCLEEAEAIYGHVTSLHVYQLECFK